MTKLRNSEIETELNPFFMDRNDALARLGLINSVIINQQGLRGYWTMTQPDSNGDQFDLSGNGRTLTYNGNPIYDTTGWLGYIDLDGTGDTLTRADEAALDITATESYIANPGCTMFCWFNPDVLAQQSLMAKWDFSTNNRSYRLNIDGSNKVQSLVSANGVAFSSVSTTTSISIDAWQFGAFRFQPLQLDVWLNEEMVSSVVAEATIFNGNDSFQIGSVNAGTSTLFNGQISICALYASALSDIDVRKIFEISRILFKV